MGFFSTFFSRFRSAGRVIGRIAEEAAGEGLGKQFPQFVREHIFVGPARARLMWDIYHVLPEEDSQNLRGRIEELKGNYPENQLVTSLCEVYKLEELGEDPLEALAFLNHLPDAEFERAMNLLRHDAFFQYFKHVMDVLGLRKSDKWKPVRARIQHVTVKLGKDLGKDVGDITSWLESHTPRLRQKKVAGEKEKTHA